MDGRSTASRKRGRPRGSRSIHPEVYARILEWCELAETSGVHLSAAAIRQALIDEARRLRAEAEEAVRQGRSYKPPPFTENDIPSLRTIQEIVRSSRDVPSGPWSLAEARNEAEARLAIAVLGELVKLTRSPQSTLTKGVVHWMVKVHSAAPDMPLLTLYSVARDYRRRQANNEPTDDLDLFLALAPWRQDDPSRFQLFKEAMSKGWLGTRGFLIRFRRLVDEDTDTWVDPFMVERRMLEELGEICRRMGIELIVDLSERQ